MREYLAWTKDRLVCIHQMLILLFKCLLKYLLESGTDNIKLTLTLTNYNCFPTHMVNNSLK